MKLSEEHKKFFSELRLVYFGTGHFAVHPLKALLEVGIRPLAVVAAPDAPAGRGQALTPPPVKSVAEKAGVPILQPERLDEDFLRTYGGLKAAVAVLAAYGKILPKKLLKISKHGFLNLHPSLLPKYRGAAPLQWAILEGEEETGVTIIQMDEQIDHGPIVARRKIKVRKNETTQTLSEQLSRLGGQLLIRILPAYIEETKKPAAQNHDKATFTRMLSREDGKLIFSKGAEYLERQVRASAPWPGAWCIWRDGEKERRLKVIEADPLPVEPITKAEEEGPQYGTVVEQDGGLGIVTGEGMLVVRKLQLEGKPPVSAKEFLNGYRQIIGSVLE